MTNEEVVEELESRKLTMSMCIDIESCRKANKAIDIAINSIQENTKLKAEIEQLKEDSKIIAKELVAQIREIDKLKSELKQSVKLPCKVGDTIYVNLPYQKPRNSYLREVVGFRYMDNSWFIETEENDYPFYNIGHSIFLTREEAGQTLKGRM